MDATDAEHQQHQSPTTADAEHPMLYADGEGPQGTLAASPTVDEESER
jgi:hypothetical protein